MKPPGLGPTVRRTRVDVSGALDASYMLTVVEGPDKGSSFTLDGSSPSRALLGTSPVCTVRLTDPEISRRHAALTINQEHVQYIDLGSTNGTTVNGVVAKEVSLQGGEAIRIGGSVITVQRGQSTESNVIDVIAFGRLLGASSVMQRLYPVFDRLAKTEWPILIEGEAGTGKELLAEELHRASKRAEGPFVVLESSSLPSDQIAARLFGGEGEPGLLESARGGVVFIDEIGNLPRHAQKRLRDLIKTTPAPDVRFITATRRDLDRDVTAERFDDALFFELANGRVELPPLRDRAGDIALLARHFWSELAPNSEVPIDLLPRFEHYAWPGNVRELRSAVSQRANFGEMAKTFLTDNAAAQGIDIVNAVIQEQLPFPTARERVLYEFERRYVEAVLARHNGNVAAAARASGVARRYFQLVKARFSGKT